MTLDEDLLSPVANQSNLDTMRTTIGASYPTDLSTLSGDSWGLECVGESTGYEGYRGPRVHLGSGLLD